MTRRTKTKTEDCSDLLGGTVEISTPTVENSTHLIGAAPGIAAARGSTISEDHVNSFRKLDAVGLDNVLEVFARGSKFRDVATAFDVSTLHLWQWIKRDANRFQTYNDAMEARAHNHVDEAHELADRVVGGEIEPRRVDLKVKLAQWSASKTRPYADKSISESHSTVDVTIRKMDDGDLASRLDSLLQVAGQRLPRTIEND